jgi:hypothetical protein
MPNPSRPSHQKISDEFAARLAKSRAGKKLQAILLLQSPGAPLPANNRRPTAQQRSRRMLEFGTGSAEIVREIDHLLTQFDGRRLSEAPSSIGTLPVETTAAGIRALATLPSVKSIMEDQPVSRIRRA